MKPQRMSQLVAIVAIGACAGAAHADIFNFVFPINTDQEVPSPNVGEFTPSGMGNVTYNDDTNFLEWSISYQGLTGEIVSPGAHFHGPADFGVTAGIQVFLSDGTPPEPATGVLAGSTTISDLQEADLLAGLWYVNIHTAANGSGEIRGQVVPTPGALALLGVGGLASLRRRRRA